MWIHSETRTSHDKNIQSLKYKVIAISEDIYKTMNITINKILLVLSKHGRTVERSVPQ